MRISSPQSRAIRPLADLLFGPAATLNATRCSRLQPCCTLLHPVSLVLHPVAQTARFVARF